MKQRILNNWPILMVATVMGFSFYAMSFALRTSEVPKVADDLSYEMPRPQTEGVEYDLSGRIVVRDIRSIEKKKKSRASGEMTGEAVKTKEDPKKAQAEAKKKEEEEKKKTAEAKKKKEEAAKKAKAEQKKKADQIAAQQKATAEAAEKERLAQLKTTHSSDLHEAPAVQQAPAPVAALDTSPTSNPAAAANETPKLSVAQWRALLFGQATVKNANEFLVAYKRGEIDANSFYQISEELLQDAVADRQKMALYILKQDPSVRTFTLLVANYQEKTPEPLKTQVYEVIKSYGEATHFPVLSKVLFSTDSRVLQMATQLLTQTVAKQNQQPQNVSGRDLRGPGSAPIPSNQFQALLPALRRLVTSENSQIAQQAQALIESIESLKKPPTAA
ncbi:MAG: hypothetical protein ACAH59_03605 [Pseudobdellovibrionaceae bacterium]